MASKDQCYIVLRDVWKSVVLPSILFGVDVFSVTKKEIKKLQRLDNNVYRSILGAPRDAAVPTLRGEIGSSEMKSRIMKGKLQY